LIHDFGEDFGLEEQAVFVVDRSSGSQPIPYFWADPQHRLGLVLAQLPDLVSDLGDVLLGNCVGAFRGLGEVKFVAVGLELKIQEAKKGQVSVGPVVVF
jgi:hypothetical protein